MLLLRLFVRFYNKRYDYSKHITACVSVVKIRVHLILSIRLYIINLPLLENNILRLNNRIFSTFTKLIPAYLHICFDLRDSLKHKTTKI